MIMIVEQWCCSMMQYDHIQQSSTVYVNNTVGTATIVALLLLWYAEKRKADGGKNTMRTVQYDERLYDSAHHIMHGSSLLVLVLLSQQYYYYTLYGMIVRGSLQQYIVVHRSTSYMHYDSAYVIVPVVRSTTKIVYQLLVTIRYIHRLLVSIFISKYNKLQPRCISLSCYLNRMMVLAELLYTMVQRYKD